MISDQIKNLIIVLNDFSLLTSIFTVKLLCRSRHGYKAKCRNRAVRKLLILIVTPTRKFKKANSQKSCDWYVVDSRGVWHCSLCRNAKFDTVYARGQDIPA
jgi:hypothetical protein